MKNKQKYAFDAEIIKAKSLQAKKQYDEAFACLERAHVLGQSYVLAHTISHWHMLVIGIKKRDFKEIIGQLFRMPLGILGSATGIVPTGNTGGSNVSAFKKMEIPEELKALMDSHE